MRPNIDHRTIRQLGDGDHRVGVTETEEHHKCHNVFQVSEDQGPETA